MPRKAAAQRPERYVRHVSISFVRELVFRALTGGVLTFETASIGKATFCAKLGSC